MTLNEYNKLSTGKKIEMYLEELSDDQETEFLKPIHNSIIEGLNTPISECDDYFEFGVKDE